MIKFYRRIRQKMIIKNKFSKYLIYAIGEIVLVVIGILIALFINNKNQTYQTEKKANTLLLEVLEDLEHTILSSNTQLVVYSEKQKGFDLVIGNRLTLKDYADSKYNNLTYLTTSSLSGKIRRLAYNNLVKEINEIPKKLKPIVKELTNFYNNDNSDKYNQIVEKQSIDNIKNRAENYKWFSPSVDNIKNEGMINYMLNDYKYKNEVSFYARLARSHMAYLLDDKKKAENLYLKISKFLNITVKDGIFDISNNVNETLDGEWGSKDYPDYKFLFFLKKEKLFYKTNIDTTTIKLHTISNLKLIDNSLFFYTVEQEKNDTILKINGIAKFRKIEK